MSGRLSSCSVAQDDLLTRKIHQTPKAPVKSGQHTPLKSNRKRSLFQPESPTALKDVGGMSPFSSSSDSSDSPSIYSPIGSPGGIFATPIKSSNEETPRKSPRHKIEVKSALFPNIKSYTPKQSKLPKSRHSTVRSTTIINESLNSSKGLTTPSPKDTTAKRNSSRHGVVVETPSTVSMTPTKKKVLKSRTTSEKKEQKPKFSEISPENFYGANKPRARLSLFQETQTPSPQSTENLTAAVKKRSHSLGSEKLKHKGTYHGRSSFIKRNGHKVPSNGVWHGIKKPKKLKKPVNKITKPLISPKTRFEQQMKEGNKKLKVHRKRKHVKESDDDEIIDLFPYNLIKRKPLPSRPVSCDNKKKASTVSPLKNADPDLNKKFFKYGSMKRATYSLYDNNVKVNISNGIMKLESPKKKGKSKKRKLFSPTKDDDLEFNENEKTDAIVQESIESILRELNDDNEKTVTGSVVPFVKLHKVTDEEAFNMLASPSAQVNIVQVSPSKILTEVNSSPTKKLLTNLSTLALNEQVMKNQESVLVATSNMITTSSEILENDNYSDDSSQYPLSCNVEEDCMDTENEPPNTPNSKKFFDVFYKDNWKKSPEQENQTALKTYTRKKTPRFVPDDQYLLDAGQASVGIVECQQCGIMYQAGDFADEAIHRNFHNNLADLRFTGWCNERIVGKYEDGRVIMVVSVDSKQWWKKVGRVIEIIDQELGFPETVLDCIMYKTVYLYVSEKSKQIVGCLVGEECKKAYRMYPPIGGVDSDLCSDEPTECKIGVSRIWTALSHRRKGVATRLVDCLQRTFLYGEIVPMEQIAFTVPSPAGKLFAQKMSGRPDILVYGMGL